MEAREIAEKYERVPLLNYHAKHVQVLAQSYLALESRNKALEDLVQAGRAVAERHNILHDYRESMCMCEPHVAFRALIKDRDEERG